MSCEFPIERRGARLIAFAERHDAILQLEERGTIVRREHVALQDREIGFDLIEPARMDGQMHEDEIRPRLRQPFNGGLPRCAEPLSTIQKTRRAVA